MRVEFRLENTAGKQATKEQRVQPVWVGVQSSQVWEQRGFVHPRATLVICE